jgi:ABC-2 type transport system permease protein
MTTPTPSLVLSEVPTATVLRRAAAAEWTRLVTVRSTWWSLLAGAALMLFIGGDAGSDSPAAGESAPIWFAAEFAILPGQFAFLLVVVLAVTGECATGAIRSSLQRVPRRGVMLAARALVPVAFVTACAVVVVAATDLVAWTFLGARAEVDPGDIARSLVMIALVVAVGSLLAVGLGLLLRNTAGVLVSILLLIFVLPVMLGNAGISWLTTIGEHLPGSIFISLLAATGEERAVGTVVVVLIAWPAVAVSSGGWALFRRDTT